VKNLPSFSRPAEYFWPVSPFLSMLNKSIIIDTAYTLGLLSFLNIKHYKQHIKDKIWGRSKWHLSINPWTRAKVEDRPLG